MRAAALALVLLLAGCDEATRLRVFFSSWDPRVASLYLYSGTERIGRLNKALPCVHKQVFGWCADDVKMRLEKGTTYHFTIVAIDKYGEELTSNPLTYTHGP